MDWNRYLDIEQYWDLEMWTVLLVWLSAFGIEVLRFFVEYVVWILFSEDFARFISFIIWFGVVGHPQSIVYL